MKYPESSQYAFLWERLRFVVFRSSFLIGVPLLYNIVLVSAVQWCESARHTHVSLPPSTPPHPIPPLQVVTERWAELPVLYSSFPLAICFTCGSVHYGRVQALSRVRLFVTLWTAHTSLLCQWDFPGKDTGCDPVDRTRQSPLPMGFPRQGYWSGLPFPSPGDLPAPGIEPASPAAPALAGGFFITGTTGKQAPRHRWLKLRTCSPALGCT